MKDTTTLTEDIALAIQTKDMLHFLNLSNYDIVSVWEDSEWDRDAMEVVEADPEKYLSIETIRSREAFELKELFVISLNERHPQKAESLTKALNQKLPFARFREQLFEVDLIKDWFDFEKAFYAKRAKIWLKDNGIGI